MIFFLKTGKILSIFLTLGIGLFLGGISFLEISFPFWLSVLFFFIFFLFSLFFFKQALSIFVVSSVFEIINFLPESVSFSLRPYQFFALSLFFSSCIRFFIFERKNIQLKFQNLFPHLKCKKINTIPFHFRFIDGGVLLLGIGSLLSSFFSPFFQESFRLSIIMLSFLFMYGIIRWNFRTKKDVFSLFPWIIFDFFLLACWGIFQNIAFLQHWTFPSESMPGRPNGFFSEPDWFGLGMALALILLVHTFLFFREKYQKKLFFIIIGIALLFVCVALIISVSRSAWLASSFGLIILFIFSFLEYGMKSMQKIGFLLLFFLVAILYVRIIPLTHFELQNRFQSSISGLQEITISCQKEMIFSENLTYSLEELSKMGCYHINLEEREKEESLGKFVTRVFRNDPNVSERKNVWMKSFQALREYGFFGVGWGSMEFLFGYDGRGEILNASNIFLNIAIGSGLLGVIGLFFIFGDIVRSIFQSIFSRKRSTRIIGYGIFSTFCVVGIFNFFNSAEFLGMLWMWLGLVVPLLYEKSSQSDDPRKKVN
ncbi:MAG: O-antigen ligase family protein [Candidatus Moraniibacteriota bacterium]|nr:MAG: O-antigen ligase family protein [Candidatus Moranbacteria bacterium]